MRYHTYYGSDLCANHFCPSYSYLTVTEQKAVIAVLDDWYLYGLVITDIDLVKEFFRQAQKRLGDCLDPGRLEDEAVQNRCRIFLPSRKTGHLRPDGTAWGNIFFPFPNIKLPGLNTKKNGRSNPPDSTRSCSAFPPNFRPAKMSGEPRT